MGVALHRVVMTRNDARTLVVYYRLRLAERGRRRQGGAVGRDFAATFSEDP